MAKKAHEFSKATLLWSNVAFCNQWKKIMGIFDECDNIRAVIKEVVSGNYHVLLVGDYEERLYELEDLELGSTGKNMLACYNIYYLLRGTDTPWYTPSYRRSNQPERSLRLKLYEIFPHKRNEVRRKGGFYVSEESGISEKIARAERKYEEAIESGIEICYIDDDWYGF